MGLGRLVGAGGKGIGVVGGDGQGGTVRGNSSARNA